MFGHLEMVKDLAWRMLEFFCVVTFDLCVCAIWAPFHDPLRT